MTDSKQRDYPFVVEYRDLGVLPSVSGGSRRDLDQLFDREVTVDQVTVTDIA